MLDPFLAPFKGSHPKTRQGIAGIQAFLDIPGNTKNNPMLRYWHLVRLTYVWSWSISFLWDVIYHINPIAAGTSEI